MLEWVSAVFAVVGFYLASLRWLSWSVGKLPEEGIFSEEKERGYFFLFLSFLAWALANGLMSLVLVWGYFADASLLFRSSLNGAVGFVLFLIGWPVVGRFRKVVRFLPFSKFERREKFILGFLAIVLVLYVYRVSLPWGDHDETAFYGYLSKLISGGRTFKDILRENFYIGFVRSQLVQSWDAQLYGLVNDTYLIRLGRLANLLFCGLGIFSFLRLIRVSRFWSLAAVAGFLSVPELSYLALSLKVDSVVMMFELAALLAVAWAVLIYWRDKRSAGLSQAAFYLVTTALLLSAFAFGNRFSGIIPMVLSAGCAWFFLTRTTKRPIVSLLGVLVLFAFFMFISAPGYWVNLALYGNPIYPTKPFWPFQNGQYAYGMEFWSNYNIVGLPPVVLQAYLIFALGIGLELLAKAVPFLNFLPMAQIRTTSMGWPYPFILCIFFWPFFMRSNRALNIIAGLFVFQLIFWSMGLHYSRLFVASSALMILAAVIMADAAVSPGDVLRVRLQKTIRVWIIFSLVLSFLMQVWWFGKRYWGPVLVTSEQRYHAKVGFLKSKDYLETNVPTLEEAEVLNRLFLGAEVRPVVCVVTQSKEIIQVLFDRHINIGTSGWRDPGVEGARFLLINPEYWKENKGFDKQALLRHFPVHVLTTPETKWEVYSVIGKKN